MSSKILVTYGTKTGSTAEIASRITDVLREKNHIVDLLSVEKVTNLHGYDTIILGSAVRAGNVLPEVAIFVDRNQAILKEKNFHMFLVCMTLKDDTADNRKIVSGYLQPIRELTDPDCEGMFAGVMDYSKLNFFEKMLAKALKAPEGDFRKWDLITEWAEEISQRQLEY